MTIPDYQSFMLPFLKRLEDQEIHSLQEMYKELGKEFELTDEDKEELLPSGRQLKYKNRIGWARTYLKKAGLLKQAGRGKFQITERGQQVLAEPPPAINVKYLERFEDFMNFRSGEESDKGDHVSSTADNEGKTPEEFLDSSYQTLRSELAAEILASIHSCSPEFFEKMVVDVLVSMGYGGSLTDAGKAIGRSGDEGIDGIIKQDKLGLDILYIQAKRWSNPVGRPSIQAFAGSLEGQRSRKGIFITTSKFTQGALDYVNNIEKKIVLIDGNQLAELMIDSGVGVSIKETYVVKGLDTDYFEE